MASVFWTATYKILPNNWFRLGYKNCSLILIPNSLESVKRVGLSSFRMNFGSNIFLSHATQSPQPQPFNLTDFHDMLNFSVGSVAGLVFNPNLQIRLLRRPLNPVFENLTPNQFHKLYFFDNGFSLGQYLDFGIHSRKY